MQSDCMNHFFSLQNLSFWALSKPSLWRNSIIFACSGETSPHFGHFPCCFVNINDISSSNFFLLNLFNHFGPQIVYALHICCFKSQLPNLLRLSLLYLNIDDFSFYYFSLFFDSNPNGSSKCLSQTLGLTHFQ